MAFLHESAGRVSSWSSGFSNFFFGVEVIAVFPLISCPIEYWFGLENYRDHVPSK